MSLSHEKSRLKYFLWELIRTYQPNCCLCNQPFLYADILPARGVDNLTEHHLNGIHDAVLSNKRLCHRICHKRHHCKDNIHKKIKFSEVPIAVSLGYLNIGDKVEVNLVNKTIIKKEK